MSRASEARMAAGSAGAIDEAFVASVQAAFAAGETARVRGRATALHHADLADLLQQLPGDTRRGLVDLLGTDLDPDVLHELDETVRAEIMRHLGTERVAAALAELETDDAVYVLDALDEAERDAILSRMPRAEREAVDEAFTYPEDSAGRLMQPDYVAVPELWTVGQTIDHLREAEDLPEDFYDIFVVDSLGRPVGMVPLSRVLRSKRPVTIRSIMDRKDEVPTIPATMDQEEVAHLFQRRDLTSAPVVDPDGSLVGVITIDDVVDVIREEADDDLMHLGGVSDTDVFDTVIDTTRARAVWLVFNLGTALLASVVIGQFAATIQEAVALAVLMPIVASIGGNAGTQTLTVVVRALAMREITSRNMLRFLGKEAAVGGLNGLFFAVAAGTVAWLWFGSAGVGIAMAAAMVITLLIAGLAGTLIPLGMRRMGADPAISSGVFLIAITDIVAFVTFLGFATLLLM